MHASPKKIGKQGSTHMPRRQEAQTLGPIPQGMYVRPIKAQPCNPTKPPNATTMPPLHLVPLATALLLPPCLLALWYRDAYQRLHLQATAEATRHLDLAAKLHTTQEHILTLTAQATKWETQCHALEATHQERKAHAQKEQAHLLAQFKALTLEVLEKRGQTLHTQQRDNLEGALKPLGTTMQRFTEQVTRTHEETLARHASLRTEVQKMQALNTALHEDAQKLTKAIQGDNRTQGQWGELVLERLLERAGLAKGSEYVVQHSFATAEGKRHRPDVIINLPQAKHIIIDAKVSLKAYEAHFHATDATARQACAKKYLLSLRQHIKNLAIKDYAHDYHLQAIDFVLLFMPIEAAFALALQEAPDLLQEAYAHNIILVSPTTLLATLRTVSYLWKNERQHKHALEIARQGGALHDKFVTFVTHLKRLGDQLGTASRTHEQALRLLAEGQGNLIGRAERLKSLGARASKTLPKLAQEPT